MKILNDNVLYGEQRERINKNFDELAMRTNYLRTTIDELQPAGLLKSRNLDPSLVQIKNAFSTEKIVSGAVNTLPQTTTHSGFWKRDSRFGDRDWWGTGYVNELFPSATMIFNHRVYNLENWRSRKYAIDGVKAISFRVRSFNWRQVEAVATINKIEPFTTTDGFHTIRITGTFVAPFSESWSDMEDITFNFSLTVGAMANADNTATEVLDTSEWGENISSVWYEITDGVTGWGRDRSFVIEGIYFDMDGGTNQFVTGIKRSLSLGQTLEPDELLSISCEFVTTHSDLPWNSYHSISFYHNINLSMLPVGSTDSSTYPLIIIEKVDECEYSYYTQGHMMANLTENSLDLRTWYGCDMRENYMGCCCSSANTIIHTFNIKKLVAISQTTGLENHGCSSRTKNIE